MPVLGGLDGVHHDRQVAARGVLHADGDVEPAGDETVLLILDGTRADSDVGENVRQVQAVFRVEQLVRAGKARLIEYLDVHFARRDQALENVRVAVRVGLVEHALVAVAGGAGLVAVDAGNEENLVLHLLLQAAQARDIVEHRVLSVGRARADEQHQAVVLSGEYVAHGAVVGLLLPGQFRGDGVHVADGLGRGQLTLEFHVHGGHSFLSLPPGREENCCVQGRISARMPRACSTSKKSG